MHLVYVIAVVIIIILIIIRRLECNMIAWYDYIPFEKYELISDWIDAVSELFGGLDMCALEIIVSRDGREAIIEVNDCALSLMGDSQEEDRRLIADLVCQKMQVVYFT